jgi:hypothetical protein
MATECVPLARASRMRLTRLDACGAPVPGPTGQLVTDGFISVAHAPNYLDPEEITQLNANGDLCIDDQGRAQLRWIDLTILMCRVDPEAFNIVTGNPLVVDDAAPTPNTVGFRIDGDQTGTANFAMELWSGVPGQPCTISGDVKYGYWLLPYIVQARVGEWTVENAALTMTLTARTSTGSGWGQGPDTYLVRADATTGTPEQILTPIDSDTHVHFEVVTVPPPAAACGAIELPADTP